MLGIFEAEAANAGVKPEDRRCYFRIDKGDKDNMRPPAEKADGCKLVSVPLDNGTQDNPGDWVGVVTKWEMPGALDGMTAADLFRVQKQISEGELREDTRSLDWAGSAVAEVLSLDAADDKKRIADIVMFPTPWIESASPAFHRIQWSNPGVLPKEHIACARDADASRVATILNRAKTALNQ